MENGSKFHPPDVVRENCLRFLATLALYGKRVIETRRRNGGNSVSSEPVRQLSADLDEYGQRLLAAGTSWNLTEWIAQKQEWLPLERSGFFEEEVSDESLSHAWGVDLRRFIAWKQITGKPLGFGDTEREKDSIMYEWLIEDVERDVRALVAAANERAFGTSDDIDVVPTLNDREQAMLDLIPEKSNGTITGKEIIAKLRMTVNSIEQSTLTKWTMPKLKAYYGVRNQGRGYFRV